MLTKRTPIPYWMVAPILQGSGNLWYGVIVWALIGAVITAALVWHRGRAMWIGALAGAITGAVGGILLLAPLWFVLPALLDRRDTGSADAAWTGVITNLARVVITLEMALLAGGLILELSDKDALDTYRVLFEWGLGTDRARANSLLAATPIIFTGLGTAIAFRAGVFNVGVEGSLYMGALFAAWVGFTFTSLPGLLLIALAFTVGGIAGGLWGLIPGYLKARLRVDEVVTTIMLNYVAIEFTAYMVQSGPFFVPGMANAMSKTISTKAQLPALVKRSQFNSSFLLALACVVVVIFLMNRLRLGYETRMVGDNPLFARWSGIHVGKTILKVMFISGLLGGLAGAGQVMGVHYNFSARFSRGFGFDGMTIALLARNSPVGVLIGALLFGVLRSGGTTIEVFTDVPIDLVDIVQALIIFFVAIDLSLDFLARRRRAAADQGNSGNHTHNTEPEAAADVA
ncbi:MAG: ABC transporter permease [Anaerolineae bacterium]|nr:ABC transporter permease [Anaerolineae bacterium]